MWRQWARSEYEILHGLSSTQIQTFILWLWSFVQVQIWEFSNNKPFVWLWKNECHERHWFETPRDFGNAKGHGVSRNPGIFPGRTSEINQMHSKEISLETYCILEKMWIKNCLWFKYMWIVKWYVCITFIVWKNDNLSTWMNKQKRKKMRADYAQEMLPSV